MPDSIVQALIALFGTVAGALIKAYAEELKAFVQGRFFFNSDLQGGWDCKWSVTFPKKENTIKDVVTLKISADRIRAIGRTHSIWFISLNRAALPILFDDALL
jgi:hypothetical protein